MAFLPRLYRFALKRLLGPFLVDNDLPMSDFDVRLKQKEIHLRNLNLDVGALNSLLGLTDFSLFSATISSVELVFRSDFSTLKIQGLTVVVNTSAKSTANTDTDDAAHSSSSTSAAAAAALANDDSSVAEGLGFLEVWVDRITATLKIEITDVKIRVQIAGVEKLLLVVERLESRNLLDIKYRKTDLFACSLHLAQSEISSSAEIASSPHVMVQSPRSDEEFASSIPAEVLVKSMGMKFTPESLSVFWSLVLAIQNLPPSPVEEGSRKRPSLLFVLDMEKVVLSLTCPINALDLVGEGLRIDPQSLTIHRLGINFRDEIHNDAWFFIDRTNALEHDATLSFSDLRLNLCFNLTVGTSVRFLGLNAWVEAFRDCASLSSSSSSSASETKFEVHCFPMVRVVLESIQNEEDVIVELRNLSAEPSSISVENGAVWIRPRGLKQREELVLVFDKFIHVHFLPCQGDGGDVLDKEPNVLEDEFESDGAVNLTAETSHVESQAQKASRSIIDVTCGSVSTPLNLDEDLYQRLLSFCLSIPPSSSGVSLSSLIRASCLSGKFHLSKEDPVQIEFHDLTLLSWGQYAVLQVLHFVVSEFMDEEQVPLCYSSPYASNSSSPSLLVLSQQSPGGNVLLKTQLANSIVRVEPSSDGFARFSEVFTPLPRDGASGSTKLECLLTNCSVDLFPSESPFVSETTVCPMSRVLLCVGEIQLRSLFLSSSTAVSRFDFVTKDAQLYLAKKSTRDSDEYQHREKRMLATNDEYATRNGFVRIGNWHETLLFVRFEKDTVELELDMKDGNVMLCPDSFQVLHSLLSHVDHISKTAAAAKKVPSFKTSEINFQANSSMSASELRKHLEFAPDSSLNAKQLKARYQHEAQLHLTPFVIEDYYLLGSLPSMPPVSSEMMVGSRILPKKSVEEAPPDGWVFAEDDFSPLPVLASKKPISKKRPTVEPPVKLKAILPPPAASVRQAHFDEEEDDDLMQNSVFFSTITKMTSTDPALNRAQDDESTIQLISREEIDKTTDKGSAMWQLHQSMMSLVNDIHERDRTTEEMAESESLMYRTALMGSGGGGDTTPAFSTGSGSPTMMSSMMWRPGKPLMNEEFTSRRPSLDGNYFEHSEGVKINNHYFPVPRLPQPGSFVPPPPALAARMIGQGGYEAIVRGKFRFILRNGNITVCLFGGNDFGDDDEDEEDEQDVKLRQPDDQPFLVVEDHFSARNKPLFPTSAKKNKSRRDVNRAIVCVASQISLLFDSFGDGPSSLCMAVHDFEIRDEIRGSPFRYVLHFWEEGCSGGRCSGADMIRFTLDVSAKGGHRIRAASLPLRVIINQDALDLLSMFSVEDVVGNAPAALSSFDQFDFRAVKMKIDFYPKRIDVTKLSQGNYVELVRLFSFEGMEVALKRAFFQEIKGTAELLSQLANFWAEDVYNKQLFKLLSGVSPGLANVASDMANIVLLPVKVMNHQGPNPAAQEAVRQSGKFAKTVLVEGIGMTTRLTGGALNVLDESRKRRVPKNVQEGMTMAGQSLASRAKALQHTIVAIPLATFYREGPGGAVKSIVRAVPIAVLQPILGLGEAFEALSSGAKHSLHPASYNQEKSKWKQ